VTHDPFAEQRLTGKVVVVTGSTQGLGAAIARRAAALGAAGVVVCGRDRERGEAVRDGLGCDALFVAADLADEHDCRAVVCKCDERFGRVDGLVNAAGLSMRGTLDDTSAELWDHLFAINARAPFLLMQEAARVMRRAGAGGSVVNIITMASHGGEHALQTATGAPDDWREAADAGRPFGRLLVPEDIAPMVTYLLSDASAMVTGSVIDFDQTVHGPYGAYAAVAA
jgi:NAD(P)-dependent dehydrogenase (short-subunit alcohol dehydrogenase family)